MLMTQKGRSRFDIVSNELRMAGPLVSFEYHIFYLESQLCLLHLRTKKRCHLSVEQTAGIYKFLLCSAHLTRNKKRPQNSI